MIAKEKSALIRRELQEIVVLTSKLTTQLGMILTSKGDHLFSSFGISHRSLCYLSKITDRLLLQEVNHIDKNAQTTPISRPCLNFF
jgi:hypothetical protein